MKIGIISGSTRANGNTQTVAKYIYDVAANRGRDTEYQLVRLVDFDVPIFSSSTHPMQAGKKYEDPRVQRWSDTIDSFDAFVFVTPEYNHGVPGGFKNAVDNLGAEWVGKPVAFAGLGSVGGVRAIEQWRQIVANFSMPGTRPEMNFGLFTDWEQGNFQPTDRRAAETNAMLDELERLTVIMNN